MIAKRHPALLILPLMLVTIYAGRCAAQSVTIFGNATPSPQSTYSTPITGGVKFWSSQAGTISAIRFYRATANPGSYYIACLYTASGGLLRSVTLQGEPNPVPGWQVANFATPISISANTTYVAAYYVPAGGSYQLVPGGLTTGVTSGPLTAPASGSVGGNGVYSDTQGFPSTGSARNSNFLVDVVFNPAAPSPYLTLSMTPPSPSVASNAPLGTVVATVTAAWSNGAPFAGTLAFGAPYSNDKATFALSGSKLIVNPTGPGLSADGNTTQSVTIVATQ